MVRVFDLDTYYLEYKTTFYVALRAWESYFGQTGIDTYTWHEAKQCRNGEVVTEGEIKFKFIGSGYEMIEGYGRDNNRVDKWGFKLDLRWQHKVSIQMHLIFAHQLHLTLS